MISLNYKLESRKNYRHLCSLHTGQFLAQVIRTDAENTTDGERLLEGKTVDLRVMEREDIDFLVECRNDIDFWGEYIPIGEQISKSEWTRYFDNPRAR